jgi:starch phosphorylase
MPSAVTIAYFSMEVGLQSAVPTYAGGLGILAGDTLRAAADVGIPMIGVSLLPRKGYFRQQIDNSGWQTESPINWPINDYLQLQEPRISVDIEDRKVTVQTWRYDIQGIDGSVVPVFLLDTNVETNTEYDKNLTEYLYGGDDQYRLCQEIILGIGGIKILRALGYSEINRYHMNEGHSSLLIFELLQELIEKDGSKEPDEKHLSEVRQQCVFTTHTPVASGHDRFAFELACRLLKKCNTFRAMGKSMCCNNDLNLTYLALDASHYINGVAKRHREISKRMFVGYNIDSITNGVHASTWACIELQRLFDEYIPDWRRDNASLRYAISIPRDKIWQAHNQVKRRLLEYVNKVCNSGMDLNVFTIGFARRATQYKRTTLLFADIERLKNITSTVGPVQLIFSGKAHPNDRLGKELIQQIHRFRGTLNDNIKIAYIPDYDMDIARLMTAGVDLWLNTPLPPMEASGTSGMKAAVNGVPSLSVLDGWWIEGCIDGVTGWAIGDTEHDYDKHSSETEEAQSLYAKLQQDILPLYYLRRDEYIAVMQHAVAINASFFNTERMLNQYITKAYYR